jgi:hypothetical protein
MRSTTRRNRSATSAQVADLDTARIQALLDRLDPKVGVPGGIPGEIILDPGRDQDTALAA